MAESARFSAISRTRPMKTVRPPIDLLPAVSAAISWPGSKSSRCTRTVMASASGHRREEGDLVTGLHRISRSCVLLVHRNAHRLGVAERRRVVVTALRQPREELFDVGHRLGRGDLLLRMTHFLLQPGEIQQPQ